MATASSAITLSSSAPVTNSTVVSTTGPAVVDINYNTSVQNFTNNGTLQSTGTALNNQSSGILLTVGSASGVSSIVNTGLITAQQYGIYVQNAGGANPVVITNSAGGTIIATNTSPGTELTSGIFANDGSTVTVNNSGLIQGAEGVWLLTDDSANQVVNNFAGGTITGTANEGQYYGIKIQDNPSNSLVGTASVYNAGLVNGLIDEAALVVNFTNASTGTVTGGLFGLGSGTVSLEAGSTLTGGARLLDGSANSVSLPKSTLILGGAPGTLGSLTDPSDFTGFGSITVQSGAAWSLGTSTSSAGFSGVPTIANFGTVDIAGALTGNVIDMEGSISGTATTVDFTGSDTSTAITDFTTNDQIVIASLAGAAGTNYTDTYNTATGVLTVTEYNPSGTSVASAMVTVGAAPGVTFAPSGSFVDITGTGGDTIVLGSSSLASSGSAGGSIFIDNGEQQTLTNTTGVDTIPVTFGTHGTSLALNVLDINGSVSGTSSPYQGSITGFGLNDDIVIGPSTLPSLTSGEQVTLAYSSITGDLTVTELDSGGTSIASTTLDVGTSYTSGSFLALPGTNGINIESPQTAAETPFTFSTTGTGDFENPADYTGGVAPGSSIVSGETVLIASGTASVSSSTPLSNSGTIVVSGSSSGFIDTGSTLGGGGTISLTSGGSATIAAVDGQGDIDMGGNSAGTTLDFTGGTFAGAGPNSVGGPITNFGTTDQIILNGFTAVSGGNIGDFYDPTTGVFSLSEYVFNNGTISQPESVRFTVSGPGAGTLTTADFQYSFNSDGNLVITDTPCFAAGTRIATPSGEVLVEDLKAGDQVITARDGSAKQIIWAGNRTVDLTRHANPQKVLPVRIAAGAFGAGLPARDLRVSPDHALFIDGYLIEAKTLINGVTIVQETATKSVTYYHIELAQHDVLLAEGLPAESYLESGNRGMFEDGASALALHPDFVTECRAAACAKLLLEGDIVTAIRARLLEQVAALGYTATDAIDLTVQADGVRLQPVKIIAGNQLFFMLPAGTRHVELLSSTGVPAEISADPRDRRTLGVAVAGLKLASGRRLVDLELDGEGLTGFHGAENGQRWTNGAAGIDLPAFNGPAMLAVNLRGQAARWHRDEAASAAVKAA